MKIEELKCPECGHKFDAKETLDETGIFSCPLHVECVCGVVLCIQAEPVHIKWFVKKEDKE